MIVLLSGGVGGAKLAAGLYDILGEELTVIVNTADDEIMYGLYVSPDIDTVLYTLSGLGDWERGWGVKNDTFKCNEMLGRLGVENWFKIGDVDMAVNLLRTMMLTRGLKLSEITREIARRLGVECNVIPMTDSRVKTTVITDEGVLSFQEYFVKKKTNVQVLEIVRERDVNEESAPGIIESLMKADMIVIAPSNPILSIKPILETRRIEETMRKSSAIKIAVTPIVGGKALRGPADKLMVKFGYENSSYGVAQFYKDLVDGFVIDRIDEPLSNKIRLELGMEILATDTIMVDRAVARRLAYEVIEFGNRLRDGKSSTKSRC